MVMKILANVMVCRILNAKQLPEPTIICRQLNTYIRNKFQMMLLEMLSAKF